jgi:hypothetical protein
MHEALSSIPCQKEGREGGKKEGRKEGIPFIIASK